MGRLHHSFMTWKNHWVHMVSRFQGNVLRCLRHVRHTTGHLTTKLRCSSM